MSNVDNPNESAAPEGARPDVMPARPVRTVPAPREPGPRGGGSLALAVLLALIALGASGYVGWRQWQQEQSNAADSQSVVSLQQRVASLETTLSGVSGERTSLNQRLNDADAVNRSLLTTAVAAHNRAHAAPGSSCCRFCNASALDHSTCAEAGSCSSASTCRRSSRGRAR